MHANTIYMLTNQLVDRENEIQRLKNALSTKEESCLKISKALSEVCSDLSRKDIQLSEFTYDEASFLNKDDRTRHLTGLATWLHLKGIFDMVEPYIKPGRKLSKFQCLILTLMRLRSGATLRDLGYRFGIYEKTAGKVFHHVLNVLAQKLEPFVYWPTREEIKENMPTCFRVSFGDCITVILDCFELKAEKSANLKALGKMYSYYKGGQTVKVLIGITPSGAISFISECYSGHSSDKFVTNDCGFLNLLEDNDVVMVDKGFTINEEVTARNAELVIPAFKKAGFQMHPVQIERTRKIANVRVHVERVIGSLRQKYEILNIRLPICLLTSNNKDQPVINKIIIVCAALLNCCPSVVPAS
jgi:hypothetical protein